MTSARRVRRAIALSSFDVPGAPGLLIHSCEDCACPVSDSQQVRAPGVTPPVAATDTRRWVRGAGVVEMRLDGQHQLLFNSAGRGGVVVVNEQAHQIFRRFQHPATLQEVRARLREEEPSGGVHADRPGDDFGEVITRLSQFDVIHPAGHPPQGLFPGGKVLTAWLHVTNACNLRCPYCYVNKSAEGMDESTGQAAVEAVIRSAIAHGFPAVKLKYAGGEASLNHRLMMKMHAHAQELAAQSGLDLQATLLSNGVALSPGLIGALRSAGIRVMISLDGLGSQHDIQRPLVNGRPSFQLVERTIGRLIGQDHAPHLSITITNRNVGGLAEVVRFALDRELTFSLNFFRDNDCAASFPDLRYQEQTMIAALLEAFSVIEESLPRWSVLGSVLDRGQLLEPRQHACGVGQDYVVIDHLGRIAKCHMEIERTLGDILTHDPLQLIRTDTATVQNPPVEEKEGCRDCTWRYWCSGGCAVATFKATGRYDIKSPNCHIYKAIYPQALRLEGLRLLRYAAPALR
ncbi:MAG TPA: radical SAM/SPASM domain-containing protein [Actinobacteria bacterium]|nr:radical SAM/SPASM domain-containing protein [Actinomycetota bacterium]